MLGKGGEILVLPEKGETKNESQEQMAKEEEKQKGKKRGLRGQRGDCEGGGIKRK